jgi:predicted ferric reductase
VIKLKFSTWVWILTYVVVLSAPLIGGVFNLAHGRGFWLNFSVALGFVALSMFGGQFVLVSRMQWVTRPMGMDALMAFHKRMAYVATVFALVHPTILFIKDEKYWPLLNVWTSPLRAKLAVAAVVALLLLVLF